MDGAADNRTKAGKRKREPTSTSFRPGQSGNPAGRRPIPPDIKAILLAGDEKAARRLVELIDDADPSIALKACVVILERNHGKPAQPVHGADGGELVIKVLTYATEPDDG